MIGKLFSNLGRSPDAPSPSVPSTGPRPPVPETVPPDSAAAQAKAAAEAAGTAYVDRLVTANLLIETILNNRVYDDPKRLERYGWKGYSQNDEDGILQEIFRRIGAPNRSFVEFGCGNGLENNTAYLLSQGWRGLWIDGDEGNARGVQTGFGYLIEQGLLRFTVPSNRPPQQAESFVSAAHGHRVPAAM